MSEKINQYDVVFNEYFGPGIGKKENGKYCLYSDYELARKRAEAAEAKLAELERQKPVAYLTWHQGFLSPDDCEDYLVVASNGDKSCDGSEAFPVFNRPAPAADLAQLVPDECPEGITDKMEEAAGISLDEEDCQDLWSVCRAAILSNIEEAK